MTRTIKTLSSSIIYETRWMRLRQDEISRPSGAIGTYTVVEKEDFAVIAAIQDNEIYLVQQYRYPVSERCWEMPQGSYSDTEKLSPADIAMRELKEETGLVAGTIEKIGFFYEAYGYSSQGCHVFLATDLKFIGQKLEPEEEDLVSRAFSLDDFHSMIRQGVIKDAVTIAAFGLLKINGLL